MKKTLTLAASFLSLISMAQISQGGLPYSFSIKGNEIATQSYEIHHLTSPDMDAVMAEDAASSEKGQPYRIGINIPFQSGINSSGTWTNLPNGDRLWRLGIHIPDAQALSLYFAEPVQIPVGGTLHVYNKRRSQFIGAYTANTPSFYAMEMVEGDLITLEYFMPAGSFELPVISISELAYYYRGVEAGIAIFRDGEVIEDRVHGSCEVDAMCDEALGWEDQRDAAVRYTFVAGGTFLCTGTVVNNTAEDCTPYILSANHCGEPNATSDINNHVWYFNYQRPTCVPGNTSKYSGAQSQTMSGGIFRASSSLGTHLAGSASEVDGCDFVLVELNTDIPTFYDVFYAGWNRNLSPVAQSGVCFHHPAGDEKKISTYSSQLTAATYNGGWAGAHWQVTWVATDNGHGVTEGGSSGSAIYNEDGLIVGHLSGGSSFCSSPTDPDLFGKFHRAWDLDGTGSNAQLKSWLDPTNSGVTTLNGKGTGCPLVGINEIKAPELLVYPNPTSGLVTIDLASFAGEQVSIEVTDISGRIVCSWTGSAALYELNLDTESSGIYIVKVKTTNSQIVSKITKS